MRAIDTIIIHCTDTKLSRHATTADLHKWHVVDRGWAHIGYHYYIDQFGAIHTCRPEAMIGAHAKGHNATSIGICLEGGKSEATGEPLDTRTIEQRIALRELILELAEKYNIKVSNIIGHNEISDKACPCFDVAPLREHLHNSNPLLFPL